MQTKGWTFLRMLLQRYGDELPDPSFQEMFLKDVPDPEAQQILSITPPGNDIKALVNLPITLIERIHYSWLADSIRKVPKVLQPQVVSLLGENSKKLGQHLNIPTNVKPLSPPVRSFLLQILFKKFHVDDLIPENFLPHSDLTPLLSANKEQLIELINLLCIFDLAAEIRKILDNNKIKAIRSALSKTQRRLLSYCMHQKEKIQSSKLDLANWNGDTATLHKQLHIRGLARLGKALSGQSPQFIWYITHTLDTGRGKLLARNIEKKPVPGVTAALSQQALYLFKQIQTLARRQDLPGTPTQIIKQAHE